MTLIDAGWIVFAFGFAAFAAGYGLAFLARAADRLNDPELRAAPAAQAVGRGARLAGRLSKAGLGLMALAALLFLAGWALR